MNKKRLLAGVLTVCFAMTGCATAPDQIVAGSVSRFAYQDQACGQLEVLAEQTTADLQNKSALQDQTVSNNAGAVAIGMVLFWPALFFIQGDGQVAADISRLKGERLAISKEAQVKGCTFAMPELKATTLTAQTSCTDEQINYQENGC